MLETLDGWLAQGGVLKAIKGHHSLIFRTNRENYSKSIGSQLTRARCESALLTALLAPTRSANVLRRR